MLNLTVELGSFDISYKPWTVVKGHVIAYYLAKIPEGKDKEVSKDPVVVEPEIDPQW